MGILSTPFRICGCGRHYTRVEWDALASLGLMDDGDGGWLDLRNCLGCASTMAVPADVSTATEIAA